MKRLLPLALALAACTPTPPVAPPSATPSARAKASATPKAEPTASATAAPSAAPAFLRRPDGAVRLLAGQVAIDARYAVSAGAGRIVSNNGGTVLAVGGYVLGSGNLVTDNGAGLISDHGAWLISDRGGAVVANNGGRLRLAQAEGLPPLGTIALAAGMAIRVRDLASGQDVPLGADAAGGPVREVLTGADGRYELFVPADASLNVLVQARIPGTDDPRFALALLSPASVPDDRLDEDASTTTRLFRDVINRAIATQLRLPPGALLPVPLHLTFDEGLRYQANVRRLVAASNEAGVPARDKAAQYALAQRISDIVYARYDVRRAPVKAALLPFPYTIEDDETFTGTMKVVRAAREAVTTKMQALEAAGQDLPAHFAAQPYIARLDPRPAIRRPSDFVEAVLLEYGTKERPVPEMLAAFNEVIADMDLAPEHVERFQGTLYGIQIGVDRAVFLDEAKVLDAVEAEIRKAP